MRKMTGQTGMGHEPRLRPMMAMRPIRGPRHTEGGDERAFMYSADESAAISCTNPYSALMPTTTDDGEQFDLFFSIFFPSPPVVSYSELIAPTRNAIVDNV